MRTEAGLKKYIIDWLRSLGLGDVLKDRKAMDDTTRFKTLRTYIFVDFPDGIWDEGPWLRCNCIVSLGARDESRYVPSLTTLDRASAKFLEQFDYSDKLNGVDFIDVEYVDDYAVGSDNHECQYTFDVFARKDVPDTPSGATKSAARRK